MAFRSNSAAPNRFQWFKVQTVYLFLGFFGNSQADPWVDGVGQITNNGKVGIGIVSPDVKLDVRDESSSPPNASVQFISRLNNLTSPGGSNAALRIKEHSSNFPFYIQNQVDAPIFLIRGNGNVGVGTSALSARFTVKAASNQSESIFLLKNESGNNLLEIESDANGHASLNVRQHSGSVTVNLRANGSSFLNGGTVGIGTTNPDPTYKLDVAGKVKAMDVVVTNSIKIKDWTIDAPDYVFEKAYQLRSLEEVEYHIRKHKHLPEVPSAKEVKEKGLDLVEMNLTLLKKVEELTLYAIAQEKRTRALEATISGKQK